MQTGHSLDSGCRLCIELFGVSMWFNHLKQMGVHSVADFVSRSSEQLLQIKPVFLAGGQSRHDAFVMMPMRAIREACERGLQETQQRLRRYGLEQRTGRIQD
jgi:hypothetical protein